jgi:16S rRNA (cytosine1402-N4)-methyltransferase
MHQEKNEHIPVLVEPVLQYLQPQLGQSYLDLTAGYGGHAGKVLECTKAPERAVLVDRDANAIRALADFEHQGATLLQRDFLTASQALVLGGRQFDIILADLGISSPHIDNAARGFAFAQDGPLDMRMDQTQELAETVRSVMPKGISNRGKTHPATRTFQALRIAVNDELELLRNALPLWVDLLAPGGRLGVISFHSLEDRLVKQWFAEVAGDRYDANLLPLTKHPVTAERSELVFNPRARSAKFRAVVKK